jgi:5-dehydro-2-deoxygluconokinase
MRGHMQELARLAGNRFLVVGRAGMDLYADPPGTRTEDATRFTAALGGSSANIAVALARLGASVDLLSCVSDDAVGRFCLSELGRYGIGRAHVRSVGQGLRTSLAVVETRAENCQSVIYRNGAADFALSLADSEAVDLSGFSAIILTGTVFAADPSATACFALIGRARAAGVIVILDIDHRPYSWPSDKVARTICDKAARLADIVIGNEEEFGLLAGSLDQGLPYARALVQDGATLAIYKRGGKGAVTITKEAEVRTGIFPTVALKPTGAGDSFLGACIAALARGLPVIDAVRQGSAAAAIVVSRVGCAPACPTLPEILAHLRDTTETFAD